ncbi:2-hydroxyacid dehydrogenase [Thalassotalea castellviae]|uniref:Glyoxylate/hydroxypyruvate reductase A n=1 Tax=Thalassotalea castellviae TaxID=3075612 RepID=A0ABU2ZY17_9GAMM|nr:glyoxylate/hydroxypyruvate reductase A [Thalassotalea sp. W431]MDT0602594.1 glyoxylate/hydroxypyruvate reductase A [Thalassotalea sp. W431]
MTQQLIPFISQLALTEQLLWLERLNTLISQSMAAQHDSYKSSINVVLADSLSTLEKSRCEIAIVANPDPTTLADFPQLVWVQSLWAGVERLIAEIPSPTFKIVRLIDPCLAQTMADAVVAWSYYLHRDMPRYLSQQRSQQWQQHTVALTSERTIGILGLGELGQASAAKLRLNGFNVLGWSRTKKSIDNLTCFSGADGLEQVCSESDIVVVLLPLTQQTLGLINQGLFSKMKPTAGLINFARGKIVHHDDLITALDENLLSHAVLDVFAQEPLPQDNILWQHPNITVLPHISAPTNRESACEIVKHNILEYCLTGKIPPSVDFHQGY